MRSLTIILILSLLASIVAASHDSPNSLRPKYHLPPPYLKGTTGESFPAPPTFSRYYDKEKAEQPPRYFGYDEVPFTGKLNERLTVSPATRAFRSLGPITYPEPTMKPEKKPDAFSGKVSKRFAYQSLYHKQDVVIRRKQP